MSALVLTDAAFWLDKYALHGFSNKVSLAFLADAPDATPFGSTFRARAAGLKSVGIQLDGFWESTPDSALFSSILATNVPVTVAPTSSVGSMAYVFLAEGADYKLLGQVGNINPFSGGAQGNGMCGRGLLMENSTRIATANGTGQNLGALSATQSLYANLHVPTVSGSSPTLDVIVQSAAASNFAGATTRATFTQITAASGVQKIVAGAVTDAWWRFVFTIGGSSPSFAIAGAMAIAP